MHDRVTFVHTVSLDKHMLRLAMMVLLVPEFDGVERNVHVCWNFIP